MVANILQTPTLGAAATPAAPSFFHRLLGHAFNGNSSPFFVDVGAFRGDFTASLLERFPDAQALLVEPTPSTFDELTHRFLGKRAVAVINLALGASRGTADFYLAEQPYQNSLLPPADVAARKTTVRVETLDHLRQSGFIPNRIDFLKTDAQGHDLRILQGAAQVIAGDQPVIQLETIFVPLYHRQDSYFDIMQFMRERRYELAGIFSPHVTDDGMLAFADLLFLPEAIHRRLCGRLNNRYHGQDADQLHQRIDMLQNTCAERLHAINQLDAALRSQQKNKPTTPRLTTQVKRLLHKLRHPFAKR